MVGRGLGIFVFLWLFSFVLVPKCAEAAPEEMESLVASTVVHLMERMVEVGGTEDFETLRRREREQIVECVRQGRMAAGPCARLISDWSWIERHRLRAYRNSIRKKRSVDILSIQSKVLGNGRTSVTMVVRKTDVYSPFIKNEDEKVDGTLRTIDEARFIVGVTANRNGMILDLDIDTI